SFVKATTESGSGLRPRGWTTFRALEHRDFRIFWVALIVSAVGTWMQILAGSLLVLDLTHGSPTALWTVSLSQPLSFFLFAPIGGSVADGLDKRRLLLGTQAAMMTLAAALGVLTVSGAIRFWMMPVFAFTNGLVLSFDQPARNSLLPSLVPAEQLMN